MFALRPLCVARSVLAIPALLMPIAAQADVLSHRHDEQEEGLHMTIRADPLNRSASRLATASTVMGQQKIFQQGSRTLGDVLANQVGMRADNFGAGASRPVIRGQTAPRVKVLSDGAQLFDASEISPDHAIAIDPSLAQRIEVLRGSAALLYGGAAIGGVVNVVDQKIAQQAPDNGATGMLGLRTDSAALSRDVVFSSTASLNDHWVGHIEGTARRANDYRAPAQQGERVAATATEGYSGALGLSWVGDDGYFGASYSRQASDYALAGHNHAYESCELEQMKLHCNDDEHAHEEHEDHKDDEGHEEHANESPPQVKLRSERLDVRGEYRQPMRGLERIKMRLSSTDYQHEEREGDTVATTFSNRGDELRLEVTHSPWGAWQGLFGLQASRSRFSALGEESFLPQTDQRQYGIFWLEHRDIGQNLHVELGARQEWQSLTPNDGQAASDLTATSLSWSGLWQFAPQYRAGLSLSRSQRLPNAQELYANGVHLATNTFELGQTNLQAETAHNVELSLRHHQQKLDVELSAYYQQANDYIYAQTLDRFENFRLIEYRQADALFYGAEVEASYKVLPWLSATVFADHVRGQLKQGVAGGRENLPRIPALRYGARLNTQHNGWRSEWSWTQTERQRDIADFEQQTPAYQMLDLSLSYTAAQKNEQNWYSVFVKGSNLLNQTAYNHSSFLANVVPLVGRNISMGVQFNF